MKINKFPCEVEDGTLGVLRPEAVARHVPAGRESRLVGAELDQCSRFIPGLRVVEEALPQCRQRAGEARWNRIRASYLEDFLDPYVRK